MSHFRLLLDSRSNQVLVQLIKYFFVGLAAFLIDYGTLFLLTEYVGLYYLISATIAFILGLVTNYLISTSWVFSRSHQYGKVKEFLIFSLIGVFGLVLNWLVIYFGTDIMGLHYLLSKLCSTVIVFFWNFFARKIILF